MARLLPVRPGLALERLVYRSQSTEAYRGAADLAQIYKVASRSNRANRITGALAISGHAFIQVIEGPAARLDELLVRLGRDSRHADVEILGRWSISARLFGAWTMAPACLADVSPELHRRFRSDGLGLELVGLLFDAANAGYPVRL